MGALDLHCKGVRPPLRRVRGGIEARAREHEALVPSSSSRSTAAASTSFAISMTSSVTHRRRLHGGVHKPLGRQRLGEPDVGPQPGERGVAAGSRRCSGRIPTASSRPR